MYQQAISQLLGSVRNTVAIGKALSELKAKNEPNTANIKPTKPKATQKPITPNQAAVTAQNAVITATKAKLQQKEKFKKTKKTAGFRIVDTRKVAK